MRCCHHLQQHYNHFFLFLFVNKSQGYASSYYHVEDREDPAMKVFSSNLDPRQPSQLLYWPTEDYDPWSEYRNKHKNSKEKQEIREV